MKIKTKLILGFGSILMLMFVLLGILLNMLGALDQNVKEIFGERYERIRLTNIIHYEVADLNRGISALILDTAGTDDNDNLALIKESSTNALAAAKSLRELIYLPASIEKVDPVLEALDNYVNIKQKIVALAWAGDKPGAAQLMLGDGKAESLQLYKAIDELIVYQNMKMQLEFTKSGDIFNLAVKIVFSSALVILIIGAGVATWVFRNITRSINKVTEVITSVSSINVAEGLPRIGGISQDEIGRIAEAYNKMAQMLEEQAIQEEVFKETIQEQNWLNFTIAEITTSFQGVEELSTLGRLLITRITPAVGASYGVFYLKKGQGKQERYEKLASYAHGEQAIGLSGFKPGEGLAGQAALENRKMMLNSVPGNYIKITSGLGEAVPVSIIIIPVEFEGQVLAVIELASFEHFSQGQESLLEKLASNTGIVINSITKHMQVQKLLAEAQTLTEELQTQSEELQTQSEELQLQQEELSSTNEKLEDQYHRSESKTKELEIIKIALEEKNRQLALNSQYKSEFLANMSHELRTPLNSLLILAQVMGENKDENLTSKQVEYLKTIHQAGVDLFDLINDMLELSKVESGKMEINPKRITLIEVLKLLEQQFSPIVNQKGLEFNIQLDNNLPETFYTDEHRLQQILANLLANAIKFTQQGSVILKVSSIDKKVLDQDQEFNNTDLVLVFSVIDTGIGIPKEKLGIIFEAFRQVDGTTSRRYGGTGLGLTISKNIAQLLGGTIKINSVEGQGSTFTLYLPNYAAAAEQELAVEKEAAAALLTPPQLSETELGPSGIITGKSDGCQGVQDEKTLLKDKKILIVDDDMRNVFALTTALESWQLNVLFAENGKQGIEVLHNNPDVDLVLMDIMMPELNGYETMQQIRHVYQFQSLPIIALTAKAMKRDREKCIEAGASDYISKPVDLEQLFSLLRVWLYNR